MPRYTPPRPGHMFFYGQKIIRVGRNVFSTSPGDLSTLHESLADDMGVIEVIQSLKITSPDELDGLTLQFLGNRAVAKGDSSTLRLPMSKKARTITLELLREETPDFPIEGREGYEVYEEGPGNTAAERR